MNRAYDRFSFVGRIVLTLAILTLGWQSATAAPAPFERPAARHKHFTGEDLAGAWVLVWSGQPGTMTLSSRGDYVCQMSGLTYVGSWHIDQEGRFCITETTTPHNPNSWRHYAVRLDFRTLSGRVEVGGAGTRVQLLRPNQIPVK
jgi:hypothetical protein